jgi:hypothetical protein
MQSKRLFKFSRMRILQQNPFACNVTVAPPTCGTAVEGGARSGIAGLASATEALYGRSRSAG